jgi:hypothetical protein
MQLVTATVLFNGLTNNPRSTDFIEVGLIGAASGFYGLNPVATTSSTFLWERPCPAEHTN